MPADDANKKGEPFPELSPKMATFRKKHGFSQDALGKLLGITGKYVGVLERGAAVLDRESSLVKLFLLLEAADPDYLAEMGERYGLSMNLEPTIYSEERANVEKRVNEMHARLLAGVLEPRLIRVVSAVQAGQLTEFEELPEDWQGSFATDCPDPKAFGVEIRGDSMEPRFGQGEVVVAMPSYRPRMHSFVVARLAEGGAVFKLFSTKPDSETIILSSLNPLYPPIQVTEEQITWCYPVWGVFRKLWQ